MVFLSLSAAVFEGFSIGMLIPFLQTLTPGSSNTLQTGWPFIDQYVLGVGASQISRLYRICGLILLGTWLRSVLSYLASALGMKARALVIEDLRMQIVDQLQAVSLSFFSKKRSGEIINSLTNELGRVSAAFGVQVTTITLSFLLAVYIALMFLISWELSLMIVVSFGLLSVGLTRLLKRIRGSGQRVTNSSAHFVSLAGEFIGGMRTVIAFNTQQFERERMQRAANKIARAIIMNSRLTLMVQPLSQAVVGTVLIVVIVMATQFFVLPGKLDLALLLAFLFALLRLMPLVHQVNGQRGQWASTRASLTNIEEILSTEGKPYLIDGSRSNVVFRNEIVFDNVSFGYEPDELVLQNIDLRLPRGKTTAIVGASGAGKSTLVDLIPRFYDPTSGRILIDGVDLRDLRVAELRKKIAVVSQETFIFNDTVAANIAYGTPGVSFDQIRDAAEKANALQFVESMTEGFETVLGDRGVRLSGGQRQRIAIARAILRDPEILILDEATSALDSVSEKLVQQSLENLRRGRTAIVIAHRLSTVENAEWVVVLEDGMIAEQGTYEDLLSRKGQLWEYHAIQFQLA